MKIVARVAVFAFGATAILWSIFAIPAFWSEATIAPIAARILRGDVYKSPIMDALEAALRADGGLTLRSSMKSRAAVIWLRLVEDAITIGDPEIVDARLSMLDRSVKEALADAPNDPFLWLVRFWLRNTREGFKPEHFDDLRMSYWLGPREAWIALRRNRRTLAIFSMLPEDLARATVTEFAGLVSSRFYYEAVDILAGPGWPVRNVLLAGLKDLKEYDRRAFARALNNRKIENLVVPGIEAQDPRPWR